jgi:lysozyme family protein
MALYTEQLQSWLFASEGGYVDHPADPGGATNHGITHKVLARWRGRPVSKQDVRDLTLAEAGQIMKVNYWDVIQGDKLPAGLDYALFDYAVNSGPGRAVKDLQRVLGVKVDGLVGLETLAAVESKNVVAQIEALCERRYRFVSGLKTFAVFGKGWTRRIMGDQMGAQPGTDIGVIDRAVMLANGSAVIPPPIPPRRPEEHGKAVPEQDTIGDIIKKPEAWGTATTAAGGLLAAVANNPILSAALAMVIVGIAGLVIFHFYQRMRKADPT